MHPITPSWRWRQVFFAPLPCQRPWVAPAAAQALLEKGEAAWAPLGFAKLVEDAAVRPGTEQDWDENLLQDGSIWIIYCNITVDIVSF